MIKNFGKFINESIEEKHYSQDEINSILGFIFDIVNGGELFGRKEFIITDDYIGYEDYWGNKIPLDNLLNYHIKMTTKGKHLNDGQLVEYTFIFTNPEGEKTTLITNMCLMVGFNYYGGFTIK